MYKWQSSGAYLGTSSPTARLLRLFIKILQQWNSSFNHIGSRVGGQDLYEYVMLAFPFLKSPHFLCAL